MRLYTLEEALTALAEVRPGLERLVAAAAELRPMVLEANRLGAKAQGNGHSKQHAFDVRHNEDIIGALQREVRAILADFEARGIEVKDPERGLIDFYSERDGDVVYLCYLAGEATISHWHSLRGGFAARQPL